MASGSNAVRGVGPYMKLSDITNDELDALFEIPQAAPVAGQPILFLLIGSPGAGKSSAHAYAKAVIGDIPYAKVDLDRAVEVLEPFRAASMISRILSKAHGKKAILPTMKAYISDKENLELFDWFDALLTELGYTEEMLTSGEWGGDAVLNDLRRLYEVRRQWYALKGVGSGYDALWKRVNPAIERAMAGRKNIVYETTMGPGKFGKKVFKFDELAKLAARYGYAIHLYHIGCSDPALDEPLAAEIKTRIQGRQEFNTPFREKPFWRYVPIGPEDRDINNLVQTNRVAFSYIQEYAQAAFPTVPITFKEYCPLPVAANVRRLPERPFNREREIDATVTAYKRGGRKTRARRRKTIRHRTVRRS